MKNHPVILKVLWALAILYPLLIVWGVGFLFSQSRPFPMEEKLGSLMAQTVVAMIPFLMLVFYALIRMQNENPIVIPGVIGATLLLLVTSILIWGLHYINVSTSSEGGVNLLVELLVMGSPVYLSLLIPVWFGLGVKLLGKKLARG